MAWTMLDMKGRWKLWDKWEKFVKVDLIFNLINLSLSLLSSLYIYLETVCFSTLFKPFLVVFLYSPQENSTLKAIPKDTWQLLLSFIDHVNDNLKNYDPNGITTFQSSSLPSD
jgi:hypothetical protein